MSLDSILMLGTSLETLLYIGFAGSSFILAYYWGVSTGVKLGANMALQAYIKEWTEIRQRVKSETWDDLVQAYSVIKEREARLKGESRDTTRK